MMVGQNIQEAAVTGLKAGEFERIPTRIQEVPELIIEPGTEQVREEIVDNLVDLGTRLATIHRTAAEAYLSQGLYPESVPHMEAAVAMDEDNYDDWNQLGYVRYLSGRDESAIQAFDRVLTNDPTNVDALYNVGMISFGTSDLDRAEACFRGCLSSDTSNPEIWNNLGVILFQKGIAAEATQCFQQALSIDPTNEDARANLAGLA